MQNGFDTYFARYEVFPQRLDEPVNPNLGMIVAIPCYNEPDIMKTICSLLECDAPQCAVEIIVVVNYSETADEMIKQFNKQTYAGLKKFAEEQNTPTIKILPILASDLPQKQAGVGLGRKIAMDEAMRRFAAINNPDGIVISCDADTLVEKNYFCAIEQFYAEHQAAAVANLYFEHDISGNFPDEQYNAIAQYELHLRYYVAQLKRISFPYAFQTVGSCFTVKAKRYCLQGGMNKRQAGEDFYFLQKVAQSEPVYEIRTTCVHPSSRISDRVPFGTGPVLHKMLDDGNTMFVTFAPEGFAVLGALFSRIDQFRIADELQLEQLYAGLDSTMQECVNVDEFKSKIIEIQNNTSTINQFRKRFYAWFNGFLVFRYLNTSSQSKFPKVPVVEAVSHFLGEKADVFELLKKMRKEY